MKMLDLEAFLAEASIERSVLERWIERRWIVATPGARPRLTDADAARAVLIRELDEDFGVNDEGIDLVLHLLDQMHGMRRLLREMRAELGAARDGDGRPGGG